MIRSSRRPLVLMAAGLLGLGAVAAATRPGHPAARMGDAAHGVGVGVCLGLEVLAVALLARPRPRA